MADDAQKGHDKQTIRRQGHTKRSIGIRGRNPKLTSKADNRTKMSITLLFICVTLLCQANLTFGFSLSGPRALRVLHATSKSSTRLFSQASEKKEELVERLLAAKSAAGVTFDDIAKKLGTTNVYCAQLFVNQAQLKATTAEKLKSIVPGISDDDLKLMQKSPM